MSAEQFPKRCNLMIDVAHDSVCVAQSFECCVQWPVKVPTGTTRHGVLICRKLAVARSAINRNRKSSKDHHCSGKLQKRKRAKFINSQVWHRLPRGMRRLILRW